MDGSYKDMIYGIECRGREWSIKDVNSMQIQQKILKIPKEDCRLLRGYRQCKWSPNPEPRTNSV